jgi:protein NrfC
MAIPMSAGYLIVDSKKCQGCQSCMMICSLVHYGEVNLSWSGIQVMQDILVNWPEDVRVVQCRQCANPKCLTACPTAALHADTANGNVRVIDESKCDGCKKCIEACPFTPKRIMWNTDKNKALKCDLCANTPYWNDKGGPGGKQACVVVCPQKVIRFTTQVPKQKGDEGYEVSLEEVKAK